MKKRTYAWKSIALVCWCALTVLSCAGDSSTRASSETEQGLQSTQATQDERIPEPAPQHSFPEFTPGAHIEPATARDYLPGGGEVKPDGSYHYALPLEVPPGRGEVTPALSLDYSSRAGNGALGVGWGVGGLSMIHPCDAIVAIDGIAAEGDKVCLDGARLIEIAPNELRTEHDQIARIVRLTAHPSFAWKVYLKDHRIRYYAKPTAASNDSPLAEEHDRSGNFTRYAYLDGSPRLIRSIQYTFHKSGAEAKREIVFHYAEREDKIARRVNGEAYRWDKRLETIEMLAPNPDQKQVVWTYALHYEKSPDTGYSRLTGVERRAASGGRTFGRTFHWSEPPSDGDERAFGTLPDS